MARKTREEKMIDHGLTAIDDLKALYSNEGRAVLEYLKIYEAYKKLYKRYEKTVTMSDSVGKGVLEDNTKLQENIDYTIQAAREKLMHNVKEHRKTKDSLSTIQNELSVIEKNYKKKLELSQSTITKLNDEIKKLKNEKTNNIKNVFHESDNADSADINPLSYKNKIIDDLIDLQTKRSKITKKGFYLAKITIDDFDNVVEQTSNSLTVNGFLKAIYKYLNSTCSKDDIVFFSSSNIFYIIFYNDSKEYVQGKTDLLNQKKNIDSATITFSMGVCKYELEETIESLLQRVDLANEEAYLIQDGCSIVYK